MIGAWRSWREASDRRARNRRRTEEILGWICVPLLLILGWYVWEAWEREVASRGPQPQQQRPAGDVRPIR